MKVTPIIPVTSSKFDLSPMTKKKKGIKAYRVIINWYGENVKIYTSATTEKAALYNSIRRLAKILKITVYAVKVQVLNSQQDRYKIEEIKNE